MHAYLIQKCLKYKINLFKYNLIIKMLFLEINIKIRLTNEYGLVSDL